MRLSTRMTLKTLLWAVLLAATGTLAATTPDYNEAPISCPKGYNVVNGGCVLPAPSPAPNPNPFPAPCKLSNGRSVRSGSLVRIAGGCICRCNNGRLLCPISCNKTTQPPAPTPTPKPDPNPNTCTVQGVTVPEGSKIVFNECYSCACVRGRPLCTGGCVPQPAPNNGQCRIDQNTVISNGQSIKTDNGCTLCKCQNGVATCGPSGSCALPNPTPAPTPAPAPAPTPVPAPPNSCDVNGIMIANGESVVFSECYSCACINGRSLCTGGCVPLPPPNNGQCRIDANTVIADGATIRTNNGCSQCTCSKGVAKCGPSGSCAPPNPSPAPTPAPAPAPVPPPPGSCDIDGVRINDGERIVYSECKSCACVAGRVLCTGGCLPQPPPNNGQCRIEANTVIPNGQTVKTDNGCSQCTCSNGVAKCGPSGACAPPSPSPAPTPNPAPAPTPVPVPPPPGTCVVNGVSLNNGEKVVYSECYSCTCVNGRSLCTGGCVPQPPPNNGQCRIDTNTVIADGATVKADNGCSQCTCSKGVAKCGPSGSCAPPNPSPAPTSNPAPAPTPSPYPEPAPTPAPAPVPSPGSCVVNGVSLNNGEKVVYSECYSCTCVNGRSFCTGGCVPLPPPNNGQCRIDTNTVIADGATIKTDNGCSQCTCSKGVAKCGPSGSCAPPSPSPAPTPNPAPAPVPPPPGSCDVNGVRINDGERIVYSECKSCACVSGQVLCTGGCVPQPPPNNGQCRIDANTVIPNGQTVKTDNGCSQCTCSNGVAKCGPSGSCAPPSPSPAPTPNPAPAPTPAPVPPPPGTCVVNGVSLNNGEKVVYSECYSCTCVNGQSLCTGGCVPQPPPNNGQCRIDANTVIADGATVRTDNGCSQCTCSKGVAKCGASGSCAPPNPSPAPTPAPAPAPTPAPAPAPTPGCAVNGITFENGGALIFSECKTCFCNNGIPLCTGGCVPQRPPGYGMCRTGTSTVLESGDKFQQGDRSCVCDNGVAKCGAVGASQ